MNFFDNHCDTVSHLLDTNEDLQSSSAHISLKKAAKFDRWAQLFALFIDDSKGAKNAYQRYLLEREYFFAQIEKHKNEIMQCRTAQDLETAFQQKKCAAILSVENGSMLGGDINRLLQLQQDGVKLLTLTWYGENEIGFGSKLGGKLKPFGREVVKALPNYDILPDISHLSDEGVEEVFCLTQGAIVASHSNVRSVVPHYRNLTNAHIQELIERKGLIGINLYMPFLTQAQTASRDDVYRHLEAFLALGAQDILAFGTDFDGAQVPPDVADIGEIPALYEYLSRKNYSDALLEKIFFGNAYCFWKKQLTNGGRTNEIYGNAR